MKFALLSVLILWAGLVVGSSDQASAFVPLFARVGKVRNGAPFLLKSGTETAAKEDLTPTLPENWPTDFAGTVFARPPDFLQSKEEQEEPYHYPYITTYKDARYQYGMTSVPAVDTTPSVILYVANDDDISKAIVWANQNDAAVAIRSGGHHYLAKSSTSGPNIQLDMSGREHFGDQPYPYKDCTYNAETNLLRCGAAVRMEELNKVLRDNKVSMPHGECMDVYVGGHCQTGGYSPLLPSHGLLLDYVTEIEIVTADGKKRKIPRDTKNKEDQDIFYSTMGGSPGNFGVLTHCTVKPIKDSEYPTSRGLKAAYYYKKDLFEALMQKVAEWSEDPTIPHYYTVSVMVVSSDIYGDPDGADKDNNPRADGVIKGLMQRGSPIPAVLLWFSYSGGDDPDAYDPSYLQAYKDIIKEYEPYASEALEELEWNWAPDNIPGNPLCGYDDKHIMPLSQIVQSWKWSYPREFNMPYVKEGAMAPVGSKLATNGWVAWVTDWVDRVMETKGCKAAMQFIPVQSPNGGLRAGNDGKTSESWRNSSMMALHDCFYNEERNPNAKQIAEDLQTEFVTKLFGEGSFFGQDRRLIWFPYGDETELDDPAVRKLFFETDDIYQRILKTKMKVDPLGIFSPNDFCVGYKYRKVE